MHKEIGRQRLLSQRIAGEKFDAPEQAVAWMGAMQAQDYAQALWAIGLRTKSAAIDEVEQAIEAGQIIRTWPMRGTLHFAAAADVRWMLDLMAPRQLAADGRRLKQLELTTDIINGCRDLFVVALQTNKRLSRGEMMALLEDAGIRTGGQRGYHILWYIAQLGVICLGPMRGKEQTFVLLDEWVANTKEWSREEALREATRRFFSSHSPATAHDFARWSGLTVTDTKSALADEIDGLTSTQIDGVDYWFVEDAPCTVDEHNSAYLLPAFDEYILGYKDRDAVLPAEHAQKIVPGNNGVFQPTIVVDGQVVGTWKRKVQKSKVAVTLMPFVDGVGGKEVGGKEVEEALSASIQAYASFMQSPISITTEHYD